MDEVSALVFGILGIMSILIGVTIAKQVVERRMRSETSRRSLGRDLSSGD